MRILLVGGGTGGSVSPLLAVAQHIKKSHPSARFLLVGTHQGPERQMADSAGIAFEAISAGKWRRYFSWQNLLAPLLILSGFAQSFRILKAFRPDCVFGAGGFVQVPMVWAAWLKKIPVVLHQQDLVPSLANKLCQLAASKITVTFESSLNSFSGNLGVFYKKHREDKMFLTGNPFRESLRDGSKAEAEKLFGLKADLPTLLVLGGGTGSEFLNNLVLQSLPELSRTVQIIHITGAGKLKVKPEPNEHYHALEFTSHMAEAYAAADFVLCRAGLSTITELSNLKKIGIIVPLPGTHQEVNALYLMRTRSAIVLTQDRLDKTALVNLVRKLLFAHGTQKTLRENIYNIMPHNAAEKISEIITKLIEKNG